MSSLPNEVQNDQLLTAGQIFEQRYEILSVLGRGANGIVYKARHVPMDKDVAIKMLLPSVVHDDTNFRRFEQEAKAASKLMHPNIITLHDFGKSSNGSAFLVMEFLGHRSLESLLAEQYRLKLDRFLRIFSQACDGLQHAHKHGVVHRDVKPSNMMLMDHDDAADCLKIVDFGLAKLTAAKEQSLTDPNVLLGTPLFMSPEQCNGAAIDHRSDIYSLACVAYFALTGAVPHMGATSMSTICNRLIEPAPVFAASAPDLNLPPDLEKAILKALSKEPEHRQQSMNELRNDLQKAINLGSRPVVQAGTVVQVRQNMARSRAAPSRAQEILPYVTAAGVLAIGLAAAAVNFFWHPTAAPKVQTAVVEPGLAPQSTGIKENETQGQTKPSAQEVAGSKKQTVSSITSTERSVQAKAPPSQQGNEKDRDSSSKVSPPHEKAKQSRIRKSIALLPPTATLPSHPMHTLAERKKIAEQRELMYDTLDTAENAFEKRRWYAASQQYQSVLDADRNLKTGLHAVGLNQSMMFLVYSRIICCLLDEQQYSYVEAYLKPALLIVADRGPRAKQVEAEVGRAADAASIWVVMARACNTAADRSAGSVKEDYLGWAEYYYGLGLESMGAQDPHFRKVLLEYCAIMKARGDGAAADALKNKYHIGQSPEQSSKQRPPKKKPGGRRPARR